MPIATGSIIWALDDSEYEYKFNPITLQFYRYQKEPDRTLPMAFILSGFAIGPSLGYLYVSPSLGNMKGLLIRTTVISATVWMWREESGVEYGPEGIRTLTITPFLVKLLPQELFLSYVSMIL